MLAVTLSKHREQNGLQLHEFMFMSNHYHLLLTDADHCLPDFVQAMNSLLSRQLNAIRAISGSNIEKDYNLVEIVGEVRLTEHAVYTQVNPAQGPVPQRVAARLSAGRR